MNGRSANTQRQQGAKWFNGLERAALPRSTPEALITTLVLFAWCM
jgi:hypothetical protein